MKTYLLTTIAYSKNERFWVDRLSTVTEAHVEAKNLKEALVEYQAHAKTHYVKVTNNALKTKQKMYQDVKDKEGKCVGHQQVGFALNASTEIYDEVKMAWVKVQLELWVTIKEVSNPFIQH